MDWFRLLQAVFISLFGISVITGAHVVAYKLAEKFCTNVKSIDRGPLGIGLMWVGILLLVMIALIISVVYNILG